MAPQPIQAKGATPPSDSPPPTFGAPRRSREAPLSCFTRAAVRGLTGRRWMMAKRILVPVGDNERAEAIVPVVAALARAGGGSVRLLSVRPAQRTRVDRSLRAWPGCASDIGV